MNQNTQNLLEKVNEKLKASPLFYFTKDAERAIGLENLLENYHIVCVEKNYISNSLKNNGKSVLCLLDIKDLANSASSELLDEPEVINWIKEKSNNAKFYSQFFYITGPSILKAEKLNSIVLNNNFQISQKFENKILQYEFLKSVEITIPEGFMVECNKVSFSDVSAKLGNKFVIQLAKGHTGNSTFVINSDEEYKNFLEKYNGTFAKFTKFIQGETYTVNGCITKNGVFVSAIQYQITGESVLTNSSGTTVGNDWSYGAKLSPNLKSKVSSITKKIGEAMSQNGFKGLFGLDLIIEKDNVFVIEINARQTANIPMQTKLELKADLVPMSLINLAEFLNIEVNIEPSLEIIDLEGSQVFLRSKKDDFILGSGIKSGIYRLQSDNTARETAKENIIFLDEDQDKPLIFQNEGYNIEDISEGGFLLTSSLKGSKRNQTEEIARMQFINGVVYNGKVTPWVLEAMRTIETMIR